MTFYHIDTDMGVDDGLALALVDSALGDAVAISTVFGNVPVKMATRNALIFRHLLRRTATWSILEGAARASDGFSVDALSVHGDDGLGGATHALAQSLLDQVAKETAIDLGSTKLKVDGPVTIIGLGPATNIPELVRNYGHTAVERIVLMSGVFFDIGNITPHAEFNAYCDPLALQATLDLGIPVTIVPLDVCRKVQLARSTVSAYIRSDGSEVTKLIVASHMHYMDVYGITEAIDGCFPHDAITVLVALAPERFFHVSGNVSVECASDLRGLCRITPEDTHVKIVTGGELRWVRTFLSRPPSAHQPFSKSSSIA
ncbi:MAG TPA: nucleoside hydrolase [Bradyrhizobium sp.]|nr:nucleoside hydrolase [Bradyrhizobium sp.]